MSMFEQALSRSDFDRCRWEEVLAAAPKKDCQEYSSLFLAKAIQARKESDPVADAVFTVLFVATNAQLDPDDHDQPFGPRFVHQAARGVAPDDLRDQHYALLAELAPTVTDPEMKARLCDLVWVMKRDHVLGRSAVPVYLQSALALEDGDNWPPCAWRLSRAARLARSLGDEVLFDSVIAQTEAVLARMNGEDPRFLTGVLMQLLQEFRRGDPAKYARLAEKAAERAEAEGGFSFDRACKLWQVAAVWHRMANNAAASEAAMIRSAETHAKDAEEHAFKPRECMPNLQASTRMERACLALKKINTPAARVRYEQLYPSLTELQLKAKDELPSFRHTLDMTDGARFAQEQVAGKPLLHALHTLGGLCKPASVAFLRQQVEETYGRSKLLGFMGTTRMGTTGKTIARAPSLDSSPEGAEEATLAQMYSNATLFRKCTAVGFIIPAIRKIRAEHHVRLQDFYEIAVNSPFVPPGRETIWAKGLHAGFTYDFIVSTHLLIPQIEHSIRLHLEGVGAITSGYDRLYRQSEFDLNTTLRMPELRTIFNDGDLVFDLRGLLIEHHGSNLRNDMAHGLLEDGQFHSEASIYLWGLCLRLSMWLQPRDIPPVGQPPSPDSGTGA
jgi:hypothetical protein